jgi:hypothetical protein
MGVPEAVWAVSVGRVKKMSHAKQIDCSCVICIPAFHGGWREGIKAKKQENRIFFLCGLAREAGVL